MFFVPDLPSAPRVWQVCFVGDKRQAPWDWFLPAGYRHAFLLGYLPEHRLWLRYEVLYHRTEISLISPALAGQLLSTAVAQGGVLSWPAGDWQAPSWWLRFGLWCVPAIKHALGLRCVALTPKQLHDFLVKNGAKRLIEEREHGPEGHQDRPSDQSHIAA